MILSVAMLINCLGDKRKLPANRKAAAAMPAAVDKVLEDPARRTRDLGGSTGCRAFANAVAQVVKAG